MKPKKSNVSAIEFHRGRPQSDVPRRKADTIDLNEDDDARYETTQKKEDERRENERERKRANDSDKKFHKSS